MTKDKNSNNLLSDITEKTSVSARVNSYIFEMYKERDIPISMVIETSLINFMKLSDEDKIKFISHNIPDSVKIKELDKSKESWKGLLNCYLENLSIPPSIANSLFTGLGVGAVALIGGFLTALDKNKIKDKSDK